MSRETFSVKREKKKQGGYVYWALSAAYRHYINGSKTLEEENEVIMKNSCNNQIYEKENKAYSACLKTAFDGNVEMDYITFGNGNKKFVILPGLSVHSVMPLAEAIANAYKDFAEEYTVYVFDRAKNIYEGYSVKDMARDTAAAMKTMRIENADVFGASQGGMIAICIAAEYPTLVNKMVLGSTLARPNEVFIKVIEEWLTLAENKNESGLLESFADKVYSEATLKAYREMLISSNRGISDDEYRRFSILAEACRRFNYYDKLSAVKCPVLAIGAEGDRVATAEGTKEIANALGCEMYLYDDNFGHGVYDEAPDYKKRCIDFFEK